MADAPSPIRLTWDQVAERNVIAHLDALPDELERRVAPTIARLTDQLLALVIAAEPVRTGALRAATQEFLVNAQNFVRGGVRIGPRGDGREHNVAAAALEYGVDAQVLVDTHSMTLDHLFGIDMPPEQVMVSAYERDVHITERRFLRDALGSETAQFEIEVQRAITEVVGSYFLVGVAT